MIIYYKSNKIYQNMKKATVIFKEVKTILNILPFKTEMISKK